MARLLVIIGAGASIDFGAPSTKRLTGEIADHLRNDDLLAHFGGDVSFARIQQTLASYLQAEPNFEQIYHVAHELLYTQDPAPGVLDEFRPIMQPFTTNRLGLDYQNLKVTIERMADFIYHRISAACQTPQRDLGSYAAFINHLCDGNVARIYTTNYDDFTLQAAPDLYTGFRPDVGGPQFLNADEFLKRENESALLFLHGSVRMGFARSPGRDLGTLAWFNDRHEAARHSNFPGGSRAERRMDGTNAKFSSVVTGLEKLSRLQRTPMSHFYAQLARDAMLADRIFVIGSGLGDLHLNTWLKAARFNRDIPPLLFVDLWDAGYCPVMAMHDRGYRDIEMWHTLNMVFDDQRRGTRIGTGWTLSEDKKSAVWERGFGRFLDSLDELREVEAAL